jgi:hypothetical protein
MFVAFQPAALPAAHGSPDIDDAHGKAGSAGLGRFIDAGLIGIDFIHHPISRRCQVGHHDIGATHETEFTAIGFVEAGQCCCAGYVCLRANQTLCSSSSRSLSIICFSFMSKPCFLTQTLLIPCIARLSLCFKQN